MKNKMSYVDSELLAYSDFNDVDLDVMKEEDSVAGLLDKAKLSDNLRKLRDAMEKLIDMVVAVRDESFSVSKTMLLATCVILEMGSDKAEHAWQRLPEQLTSSGDFIDVLKELMAMCKDPQCKDVLDGTQDRYAGSCRRLAGIYADRVREKTEKKALLYRQQHQGILPLNIGNDLDKENQAARLKHTEVYEFCRKYRYNA